MDNQNENNKLKNDQIIHLINRKNLQITDIEKIISLKPELIQLSSSSCGIIIDGKNMELTKLDNHTNSAEIVGEINQIKFVDKNSPKSILRKIFKWYILQTIKLFVF